jgi:CyaY protein
MTADAERDFEVAAERELLALQSALDAADLDVEVELQMGILTIELSDGTKYVVNSHRAARQIWMAADRAAWHFDYDDASHRWTAAKTGDELWSTMERVLASKTGKAVDLKLVR